MVGQPKLLSGQSHWRKQIEASQKTGGPRLPSLLLFGPPGCGKTTLARIVCATPDVFTETCHAIETGAKQLKEVCDGARMRLRVERRRTVVFVDEIHRLNRAQQDVLLASLESGDVSLIGATTENPSHSLNPALISRCQVLAFEPLTDEELTELVRRGFNAMGSSLEVWLKSGAEFQAENPTEIQTAASTVTEPRTSIATLISLADGDARKLLNAIEWLSHSEPTGQPTEPLTAAELSERLGSLVLRFDRAGDAHYDTISALIKSIRGSDPDAAIYYLARLVRAEEDVAFLARRLVILASEDIGNADPRAIQVAVAGFEAVTRIGWPEARITFAQVVTYLACAPKSNASYVALDRALALVDKTGSLPIPLALRSSKTKMSKSLGYGRDYKYSHGGDRGFIEQTFLPAEVANQTFLELTNRGFEKNMQQYQDWIRGKPVDQS